MFKPYLALLGRSSPPFQQDLRVNLRVPGEVPGLGHYALTQRGLLLRRPLSCIRSALLFDILNVKPVDEVEAGVHLGIQVDLLQSQCLELFLQHDFLCQNIGSRIIFAENS